ncbi:formate dehydrogenase accessory sulfurtransferase FdhD [Candidatus Acetothermia bacterium]|nr:formate dehydrogenase accessory sulfurtransferase FdhD [Candidatus Acetothermia bacterium]MBI3644098.1 formate dehydrogenase accessory sulfurtransferase FdhD [Candidatus Acetothermia bacterium]
MIPRKSTARAIIQKVSDGKAMRARDLVAVEEPLEIRLGYLLKNKRMEQSISITMRTPGEDFQLAAGFLCSEGIIQSPAQILQMSYCVGLEKEKQEYNIVSVQLIDEIEFDPALLQRNFYTTSSCGVCGKASLEALQVQGCPVFPRAKPLFASEIFYQLPEKIRASQSGFEKTGGLHAAALFDPAGNLITLHEDVGRHNAVDKLIGEQFLASKLPLNKYLMMVSGRASFEIVQKALMASIPVVAAVGAPSSLAIELARKFGMTLIGFLREKSFNLYSEPDRIAMSGGKAGD